MELILVSLIRENRKTGFNEVVDHVAEIEATQKSQFQKNFRLRPGEYLSFEKIERSLILKEGKLLQNLCNRVTHLRGMQRKFRTPKSRLKLVHTM